MNYQETLAFLFNQLPMYQRVGKTAFKKDLSNTLALCKALGNPQDQFKSIHVAGTNGKGSVSHMLASVYQSAGYKTGLYTSPHLKDFRERIRINGEMISEEEVVQFVDKNSKAFNHIKPSFFEWTVALAFHHFAQNKVDIAIIETGLGGRLDSTNVITPELSIITNIGLDHTEFLGDTHAAIATEKAGIIKDKKPVIIGNAGKEREIFIRKAQATQSNIYFATDFDDDMVLQSDLKGDYQKENIKTVVCAWNVLKKGDWEISSNALKNGLLKVVELTGLQGRWQRLNDKPKVIADTAHNQEGFQYNLNQIKEEEFNELHMVLGFVKEKSIVNLLKDFPKNATYYFCEAAIPRAMSKEILHQEASKAGLQGKLYNSVHEAYEAALKSAQKEDFIYIGGSNFVVAEIL